MTRKKANTVTTDLNPMASTMNAIEDIAKETLTERKRITDEVEALCQVLNKLETLNKVLVENTSRIDYTKGELGYSYLFFTTNIWSRKASLNMLASWEKKPFDFISILLLTDGIWVPSPENNKVIESCCLWKLKRVSTKGLLEFLQEALSKRFAARVLPETATPTTDTTE